MNKAVVSIGGLLAAGALLVGVTVLSGVGLKSARLDLTENKLYTLSQGSRNIASKLKEPIKLTLYYSDKQSSTVMAQLKSYSARVKEVLREYVRASGGKIELEIVDPEPATELEDKAVAAELLAAPIAPGETFYFGLVGVNSTDRQETVKFFDPRREEFLEYDLTRLIYLLSEPPKKTVGLMSWLPIEGSSGPNPMQQRQQQTPPWIIVNQMREVFDVRTISPDAGEIPSDVKVLMVVHPKGISDKTQYAIDQFVLHGGRAVVFVDPQCEADVPPGVNPMQAMQIPKNSNLTKLFDAWGLEMVEGEFAADRESAMEVTMSNQGRPERIDYLAYIELKKECLDLADAVTGQLEKVRFATSGALKKKGDAGTAFTPLVHTTSNAAMLPTSLVSFMPEPKKLLADFKSGDQALTVAARVTGKAKTAFPDGRPAAAPPPPQPNQPPPAPEPSAPDPNFISEAKEPINVIVVADCDMLTDRFWVNEDRMGSMVLGYRKAADNGDLVVGAIDNLSGSSDLISVRSRGKFTRPFDRVVKMEKDAQKKYAEEEQKLQTKLQETEQRINEIQQKRGDKGQGSVLMTLDPAQEKAIESFRKERIETRKQLRQVQVNLRKDIDGLGTKLKFINVGLMPLAVGCAAVGLSAWRAGRRRGDRWKPKPRD